MNYKKFITITFISTLCLLIPIALFNRFFDYSNIFKPRKFYEEVAKRLRQGFDILNFDNCDYHLLQESLIKDYDVPDIMITGSSRVRGISQKSFKENTFFNHWISDANWEDYFSILGCYQFYKKKLPKTIIISIDPWIFNPMKAENKSNSLKPFAEFFTQNQGFSKNIPLLNDTKLFIGRLNIYKMTQLINLSILTYNYSHLRKGESIFKPSYISSQNFDKTITENNVIFHSDGSSTEPITVNDTPEKLDNAIAAYFREGQPLWIGKDLLDQFIKYTKSLKRQQSKIYFLLLPYHPAAYQNLANKPSNQNIVHIENIIRSVAQENGIDVLGSYDPHQVGIKDNQWFYDENHVRAKYLNQLFISIFKNHKHAQSLNDNKRSDLHQRKNNPVSTINY